MLRSTKVRHLKRKGSYMSDRIRKSHTPEYVYLKGVATRLEGVLGLAKGHTRNTMASARRYCVREWDTAVAELLMKGAEPGTINAARRRLREKKELLTFLVR
jgi:hypothetical protein